MKRPLVLRVLAPVVEVRREELQIVLLMFAYSFLAMTAYNIVQPITRSRFITALGADNLPYVLLASAFVVGLIMQGYSRLGALLPGRWIVPVTQAGIVALLAAFWVLFPTGGDWVEVAFYLFGQIYGILLISQFWTLANLVFNAREAKRLFGFIGGGATTGGIAGGSITAFLAEEIGNRNLVLASAIALVLCGAVVVLIVRRVGRERLGEIEVAAEEKGVGGREALRLLARSRHLQIIALVIALTSIGAGLLDQQLNMAAEAFRGRGATDAITEVLGRVQVYVSAIGLVIQIWLTSRIHRLLGVGFALMILPVGLGLTGGVILLNAALWAPMFARVLDKSLRYTVDKTTREVLFLPLPPEIKQQAKPFVDVTVDRAARAVSALVLLVLIQPWGLNLNWQQVSYASLAVMGLWIATAIRAKRGYVAAFRRGIEEGLVRPAEVRTNVADLSTIEMLVEELAHPDESRVLYAIDILESLDKRNLITPLLLRHESPLVRARALAALGTGRPETAERWLPSIQRLMSDASPEVRAAAVSALSIIRQERATELVRPYLEDTEPRVVSTAAAVLARSSQEADRAAAEAALSRLAADTHDVAAAGRREVAAAIAQIADDRFHHLLIPLLYDANPEVAEEALKSLRQIGRANFLFVPTLVSLLRNRRLKAGAREVLIGYGEDVLDSLAHFLRDRDEDIWVRRHIPATLARMPYQQSMDILVGALADPDGFLRYKALGAIERLHREQPALRFPREPIEALAIKEARRYFTYLSLRYNLAAWPGASGSLLVQALDEKIARTVDRVYRLLGLIHPWRDIAAARWALERGDARLRASASEYLDNSLAGALRKWVMPMLEDLPADDKVRRANVLLRTRPRGAEETLLALINDEDPVMAASAISLVAATRMWTLAEDIEHVLAHREPADWFVFEAASWAAAEHRLPRERRRALWAEPLPAVELAARIRGLPIFASVSVDELFRISGTGRQIRYEPGRTLQQEGVPPETIQFLLDGTISWQARGGAARDTGAPAAVGLEEALEGTPARQAVRAVDACVCLSLTLEECQMLLADNTDLVQGLFRMLVTGQLVTTSGVLPGRNPGDFRPPAGDSLTPIEKVLALQQIGLFCQVGAAEMLHLAAVAREVPLPAGALVFAEADPAAIHVVLSGQVGVEADGQERTTASPGDALGVFETLAALPAGRHATVRESGVALRLTQEDLFDLLGQRQALLQALFCALFSARPATAAAA